MAAGEIADLASRFGAIAVMPLDDPSLWLCDQAASLAGIRVVGPTGEQARLALDKRLQIQLAQNAGLQVPPTDIYDGGEGLPDVRAFPVVLRPALALFEQDGKLARSGTRVCADADELRAAADDLGSGPILVQPFLRGGGEGLFGFAVDGAVHHWSAHRRLRMVDPQGSGSSACVSKTPDLGMTEPASRMMADAGWRGLFMLEFLRDRAGTPWFMELNGRTWGSLALARRLGLEYPAWAALEALELGHPSAVPEFDAVSSVICRHLGPRAGIRFGMWRGSAAAIGGTTGHPTTPRSSSKTRHRRCARPGSESAFVDRVSGRGTRSFGVVLDGRWTLGQLAEAFADRHYQVVLTAEHDRTFDAVRWEQYRAACANASTDRVRIVPGIEYSDGENLVHVPVWGAEDFLGVVDPRGSFSPMLRRVAPWQ